VAGAAARTSVGREYHHVGPGQQLCDITGRGCLQVADGSFGAGLVHIGGVGRVPDQPCGLVTALSQEALQQERDLPVPARDHDARAASLLTEITGRGDDDASGPCTDRQGPPGPPSAWQQSRLAGRFGDKSRRLGIDRPFVQAYSPPQVNSSCTKRHILALL
jgi:hypothetical protein